MSRSLATMRARRERGEGGFTLLELVVSLTIIAIGIVGTISMISSSSGASIATERRNTAVNLATQNVEATRAMPYANLIVSNTTTTNITVVKATTYTISKALVWATDGVNAQAYKQVTVDVTWRDRAGLHTVNQSSLISSGTAQTTTSVPCSGPSCP